MPAGRRGTDFSESSSFRVDRVASEETRTKWYAGVMTKLVRGDQELAARARLEPSG